MNLDPTHSKRCPFCLALNQIDETRCILCDHAFGDAEIDPRRITNIDDHANKNSASYEADNRHFSIASLMLFIAFVAVCLAAFRIAPGLGALVVFFSYPAFVRTLIVIKEYRLKGRSIGPAHQVILFLGSFFGCVGVPIVLISALGISIFLGGVLISGSQDPISITTAIVFSACCFFTFTGFFIVGTVRWFRYK